MQGSAPSRWTPRVILLAILLGTALLRLRLAGVPLERDEGEYAYMGQLILRGEVPYIAAYNMKLPGAYYANAAVLALFGESDVGIRSALVLINAASIVLLHLLGRRLIDVTAGLAAAAAFAVLSLSPSVLGFAAKAEHFVVLFVLAGLLQLARLGPERRLPTIAGAGLLFGVAVLMKQSGGAFIAFALAYLVLERRRHGTGSWRRVATECVLLVATALLPFALTCLGMYLAGAFERFWFWTFSYARTYAVLIPLATGMRELGTQLSRIGGSAIALWLLAAVGLTALGWDRAARRSAAYLVPLLLCSILSIFPGLRFSAHYFLLLLPAVSLLVGVAVSALARATTGGPLPIAPALRAGLPLLAVGLSLAQEREFFFALSPAAASRAAYGSNPFPEAVEIARYLREHSRPGDRIAVVGSEPQIYFYAGRQAATSYIYMYPLMEAHGFSRRLQEDMIAEIERRQPRFMVLVNVDTSWSMQPDSSRLVLDWAQRTVNDGYEPVGLADIIPGQETVYRWDADAREARPQSRYYVAVFERRRPPP
jgi:hypothetical protein